MPLPHTVASSAFEDRMRESTYEYYRRFGIGPISPSRPSGQLHGTASLLDMPIELLETIIAHVVWHEADVGIVNASIGWTVAKLKTNEELTWEKAQRVRTN
jgi:hypothetical protein